MLKFRISGNKIMMICKDGIKIKILYIKNQNLYINFFDKF